MDAERDALRKAGYTETEVSQILVSRALAGSQQPTSAPGSGVLSGTLSSLVAVASHARFLIPTFRKDITTIFDGAAPASSRAGATASLAVKAVVVAVLGYAGWQEWNQHIISATAIADAEVRKRHAEECSARMKAMIDTVPMNKLLDASDLLERDCDPTYAARAKACDERFQSLLGEVDQMKSGDPEGQKAVLAKVQQHKNECTVTEAQRQQAAAKMAKFQARATEEKASTALEVANLTKMLEQMGIEHKARHFDEAYKLAKSYRTGAEALETKKSGKPGPLTSGALNSVAWRALFVHEYAEALAAAERALQLDAKSLVAETNRAHALMLLGRTDEAKAIYLAHMGQSLNGKSWEQVIRDDFDELWHGGVTDPLMVEVEKTFRDAADPKPPAPTTQASPSPAPPAPPPTSITRCGRPLCA